MFHHDETNMGYTPDNVLPPLALNWVFDTDGELIGYGVLSSPAVSDGVVFIGSDDCNIYALNATTGVLIWKYQTEDWVRSTPAVHGKIVYVASQDGYVYALHADNGTLKWKYGPAGGFQLSSSTVEDGRLYVASAFGDGDPRLVALNIENGTLAWEKPLSSQSTPALADGIVYIGTNGWKGELKVYALNETDGSIIWQYDYYDHVNGQEEFFNTSPTVANGIVYIASGHTSGRIHALNASTGELIWMYESGYVSWSSPAIAHGIVYIGSYSDYNVYALDARTGDLIWKYPTGNHIDYSSPAITDEVVYICSSDGYLYALNATSGLLLWKYPVGQGTSPAVAEGKVFVGSGNGNVYSFTSPPVARALSVSMSPLSVSILVGQSVTFASDASGGFTPYSYQWFLNETPVLGAMSASWTFTPPRDAGGVYSVYVEVTDAENSTAQSERAWVSVANPFDVTGDGKVRVDDVYAVAKAFGSQPGDPRWNPKADINGDGRIRVDDVLAVALHFGQGP